MKLKTGTLLGTFFWCWFMGITAISIGLGAVFPSLNLVAKPLICPAGKMDLEKQVYNPYPGKVVTTITWYCTKEGSDTRTELGIFPMALYAGTFYGILLFVVVVIGMSLSASRTPRQPQYDLADTSSLLQSSEDILARMKELKNLRAANLISEAEYEEKRKEILKSL